MVNSLFTNGMIAVKEKSLFGEKLLRFAELSAEEVLRALRESGFGGSEEEEEGMLLFEERALDAFIREYAPSAAERAYLLTPRDFHNAKALVKAQKLGMGAEKYLAPMGEIDPERLAQAISEGAFEELGPLGEAMKTALEEELTGGEIGALFEKALFAHLKKACARSLVLRRLLRGRGDRVNLLTALRAEDGDHAKALFVPGGSLGEEALLACASGTEEGEKAAEKAGMKAFYGLCLAAKAKGAPFTAAERELDSFEAAYFYQNRFELEGKEPFLYYVFRRRAEIADIRVLLVCLKAGLKEQDVKRRLRSIRL